MICRADSCVNSLCPCPLEAIAGWYKYKKRKGRERTMNELAKPKGESLADKDRELE